ncbi:hypothetical protein D9757_005151 [Collybiopsis confluens]|uniref:Uncharacterized protein n=1 Tax=Collybiopsis confluens TaxID=2823264 RepID=A0A8H5HT16_9AGAR|nr:hypothetical protein D9757_005151 [Collybiopsis confluens]
MARIKDGNGAVLSRLVIRRHASIDPATRAARGLPEDLIQDSSHLLDDLEHALIDAGAIAFSPLENKYIRVQPGDTAAAALNRAVEQLATGSSTSKPVDQEWFHVHGVTAIAAAVDR